MQDRETALSDVEQKELTYLLDKMLLEGFTAREREIARAVAELVFKHTAEWPRAALASPGDAPPQEPTGASSQAETREDMGDGWYVTVGRWAESIVTIEQRSLSGKADLTDDDAALIRGAAKHLQAFIGQPMEPTPEPETCEWRIGTHHLAKAPCFDSPWFGRHAVATWNGCPYCLKPLRLVPSEER